MKRTRLVAVAALTGAMLVGTAAAARAISRPSGRADLQVAVFPSLPSVYFDRKLVYHVIVGDAGESNASGVSVTFAWSAPVELGAIDSPGASCARGTVLTCSIAWIRHGRSTDIRVSVRPQTSGQLLASASASMAGEASTGDNEASVATTVHPGRAGRPNLVVLKVPSGPIEGHTATLRGRIAMNEPTTLTWRVVSPFGQPVELLHGSLIHGRDASGTSATISVGGLDSVVKFVLVFDVPDLTRKNYSVRVHAVDLEDQARDFSMPAVFG